LCCGCFIANNTCKNNPCAHLCFPSRRSATSFVCACSEYGDTTYRLAADNTTCLSLSTVTRPKTGPSTEITSRNKFRVPTTSTTPNTYMGRTTQLSSGEYYTIHIYVENYATQFWWVLQYSHIWGELRNPVLVSTILFTYIGELLKLVLVSSTLSIYMGRTMHVSSGKYYTIHIYGENYATQFWWILLY